MNRSKVEKNERFPIEKTKHPSTLVTLVTIQAVEKAVKKMNVMKNRFLKSKIHIQTFIETDERPKEASNDQIKDWIDKQTNGQSNRQSVSLINKEKNGRAVMKIAAREAKKSNATSIESRDWKLPRHKRIDDPVNSRTDNLVDGQSVRQSNRQMDSRSIKKNHERTNEPRDESPFIYKRTDDRIDNLTDILVDEQSDRQSDRQLTDQKYCRSIKRTNEDTDKICNESHKNVRIGREAYGPLRAYGAYFGPRKIQKEAHEHVYIKMNKERDFQTKNKVNTRPLRNKKGKGTAVPNCFLLLKRMLLTSKVEERSSRTIFTGK